MRFRTHVGRSMDLSLPSNRLIIALTAVAAVAAVVIWLTGDATDVLLAPVHVFLTWALLREIDPDHDATAIAAGVAAGVWVLAGLDVVGLLEVGAVLLAARLVVNSTGRRPLLTDLIPIGLFAALIAFTTTGWVAGFGLALAIYIDDRMAPEHTTMAAVIAALAALGASAFASASRVFPQQLPDIRPLLVVGIGGLALIAVIREPEAPTCRVDSRLKYFIDQHRLHASRSLVAVLIFAMAVFTGGDALATTPLAIALALALASNEIARIRRR